MVRSQYQASDVSAAGAWTWEVPGTGVYVLIDVQSQIQDLVQARAELWLVNDSTVSRVGRSDVMPSAAEFGAFAFEDMTDDGLPDLFGYVADSAGIDIMPATSSPSRAKVVYAAPPVSDVSASQPNTDA